LPAASGFPARKRLGLKQDEFGEKLGVTRQTIVRYERGETLPEVAPRNQRLARRAQAKTEMTDLTVEDLRADLAPIRTELETVRACVEATNRLRTLTSGGWDKRERTKRNVEAFTFGRRAGVTPASIGQHDQWFNARKKEKASRCRDEGATGGKDKGTRARSRRRRISDARRAIKGAWARSKHNLDHSESQS
jgi:transcriptional regulator with XRE-family HTH domain